MSNLIAACFCNFKSHTKRNKISRVYISVPSWLAADKYGSEWVGMLFEDGEYMSFKIKTLHYSCFIKLLRHRRF